MPYKGSERELQLLNLACKIASANKASLTLVHVLEVPMSLPLDATNIPGTDVANALLDEAEAKAAKLGANVSTELLSARDAGHALLEAAKQHNPDLILMESILRSRPDEKPLGNTTEYLLENAPGKVWIHSSKGFIRKGDFTR